MLIRNANSNPYFRIDQDPGVRRSLVRVTHFAEFHEKRPVMRNANKSPKMPYSAMLFFLAFFLIWGGTRSLRMPALRPSSQTGPMRNPREEISVVLRDTIRLT